MQNQKTVMEHKILRKCVRKRLQSLVSLFLVLLITLPVYADKAKSAYNLGVKAEAQNKYDAAFEAYRQAYALKPRNPQYLASYTRLRSYAAIEHIRAGQLLRNTGKLPEAFAEFQRAAEIDSSTLMAQQEAQRTAEMIRRQAQHEEPMSLTPQSPLAKMAAEIGGPIELQPISNSPVNLRLNSNADQAYKTIGKMAGINVLIDPDYRPQHVSIELNDVTTREALQMLALESKTFWQPVSANTIIVAADTAGKRKELEGNVMKAFYLRNIATPAELQEAANTIRGMLDVSRVQLIPAQNAIVLRGTPDQMVLAEMLLTDIDKPKSEVVINIAVLEVSRDRVRTLGISPPTSSSIVLTAPTSTTGTGGATTGGGNQFPLNTISKLTPGDFLVTIPGATLSILMSDSNTKVIQNPEIRALDNEKASLKIGDRIPIATGSFGATAGGVSPLVNTQFQYLDVGVNVDIVPHIHSESEVTLKMSLEISNVSSVQNIGGINQPVIGQRRIDHETRLQDGDVSLVGGILEDTETQSLSGYPWITKIPILKYLFAQENKEKHEKEIVFAITPHIVRPQELTEQNLRVVDVGNGNAVVLSHKELKTTKPNSSTPPATPTPRAPVPQAAEPQANLPVPPPQPVPPSNP
jgi:general secretion pathway protein D